MIFLIFISADLMNSGLALTQVPNQLAQVVGSWGLQPLMVVTAILLFYVVLGAVMDALSMLLLTIPIFFPMVMAKDVPISESYRGGVPFPISDALRTALRLFFPGISLWLVKYIS